jgi:hypothetical protein
MTLTLFDPLESSGVLDHRMVQCPRCREEVAARERLALSVFQLFLTVTQHFTMPTVLGMLSRTSVSLVGVISQLIKTTSAVSNL